jgi:vancomycin resistance protein VanJ
VVNIFMRQAMFEQSSDITTPSFFRRLSIAAAQLLISLHTGLVVIYYVLHALSGSDLWFIDALGFLLPWLFIPSLVLLPLALWNRLRRFSILAIIPLALFVITYGHLYLPRLPVVTTGPTFTVMTHNVLYKNLGTHQILGIIETNAPDIIGLSELDTSLAQELVIQIAEDYPYYYLEDGHGIFSRYPIESYTTFKMSDMEWGPRLAQKCVLNIDGHRVTLIHAHPFTIPIEAKEISLLGIPLTLPLGLNNQYRDADINGVLSQMEQVEGSLIVIGDFNLTDQQNGYKSLTQNLQDAHKESGWGLDFTFTRFPQIGTPMWRIDYVLYSPDMTALSTTVGEYGGSDHKPVIAKLGFLEVEK